MYKRNRNECMALYQILCSPLSPFSAMGLLNFLRSQTKPAEESSYHQPGHPKGHELLSEIATWVPGKNLVKNHRGRKQSQLLW